MKKRIISVLSILMLAICLAGCSAQVTSEKVGEMTEIAQNIKDIQNYQLPEGYTLQYADNTKNDRITLMTQEEFKSNHTVKATFDISKEKVELLQIGVDYTYEIGGMVFLAFMCFLFGIVVTIGICARS